MLDPLFLGLVMMGGTAIIVAIAGLTVLGLGKLVGFVVVRASRVSMPACGALPQAQVVKRRRLP